MSNELTDVRCHCGAEFPADSYDAGFIAGSGMCQNCDAAMPPKDIPALVDQAGGDERAAFEAAFAAMGRPVCRADYDQDAYGTPFDDGGWTGWQARAALAQPSPMRCLACGGYHGNSGLPCPNMRVTAQAQPSPTLPPFAEKVLAKLRRFNECAEDSDSGGVDIGRHWLDLLTQLGLLNRVQRSPALWEISQQGEDLLGLDVPEIEVPDSMIEKAWQRFERTLQQLETPGQAEQAEQAEAERPVVIARLYRVTAGPQTGWSLWHPGKGEEFERSYTVERRPLMTVAQYDRIVGELRAVIAQLRQHKNDYMDSGQETYRALQNEIREREAEIARLDGLVSGRTAERDAANARLHEVATACATAEQERDAALARVAEYEAQAQHSVPGNAAALVRAEAKKYSLNAAGMLDSGAPEHAQTFAIVQLLSEFDDEEAESHWEAIMAYSDFRTSDALFRAAELLAAASGKEVGHE